MTMTTAQDLELLEFALAPIRSYLLDKQIVEIALNPDGGVFIYRGAKPQPTNTRFSPAKAELLLREIAAAVGCELNIARPSLACRMPIYRWRVQGVIPPRVAAPTFNLRRAAGRVYSLTDYVEQGIFTQEVAAFLAEAVANRLNILVGGETGSGKTTLINALLRELVDTDARVILIEDTEELQCPVTNSTAIQVEPPDYTWKHAVRESLRMRPDRIILGELRDGVALDFLKAVMTHRGGIATLHASSTCTMLDYFCTLVEEVVENAARETVAQNINLLVHMTNDPQSPKGVRLTGIERVHGYDVATRRWLTEVVFSDTN